MAPQRLKPLLFWLLMLLPSALPVTSAEARPSASTYAPVCHAATEADVSLATMAADLRRWHCGPDGWDGTKAAAWLRFDAAAWRGRDLPTGFLSHITRLSGIAVAAVDADGTMRTRHFAPAEVEPLQTGPLFTVPLPELRDTTSAVIVRIDRPHNLTVLTEAQLARRPHLAGWPASAIALLAVIAGMLVIPLVYDVSFYAVLRERFLLLHALMIVSMLGYLLFSGGLALAFVSLPITAVAITGPLFFAIGAAASAFFLLDFLEADAVPPRLRRLLQGSAWWSMLVPGTLSLQLDISQPFDNLGYFYTFVPVLLVFAAVLATALVRGSRAARLIAIAWVPLLLCGADRILRGTGVYTGPNSLDRLMFVAFALEVFTVWLAVSQRFMLMKRDRDRAWLEARSLERLSERDPLTGLLNRRALEDRFALLRAEGFTTLAVIDLDHFKRVNDTRGHSVGDRVLKVVARVLAQDADTLAFRLGGEDFLLLLRGRDAMRRAENRRRAISTRIAEEVEGLDGLVTASMGLVEVPASVMPNAGLAELYDRADRLLYEAKQAGRNRTMNERLKAFSPRRTERRKSAA
jgi:diguanylate cyclase (GGDEF)-like protein